MRERLEPEFAGLGKSQEHRKVPGLRREEVAQLSGISLSYYTRLERGDFYGASDSVLFSVARALNLSDTETKHMMNLVALSDRRPIKQTHTLGRSISRLSQLVDSIGNVPAMVVDRLGNPLYANETCQKLYPDLFPDNSEPLNLGRYLFLDPRSRTFYADWDTAAWHGTSNYRFLLGRFPDDPEILGLIEEFKAQCIEFDEWWSEHSVRIHSHGSKEINHPVIGRIEVHYEVLFVESEVDGLSLMTYFAEPNSASADALRILQSFTS